MRSLHVRFGTSTYDDPINQKILLASYHMEEKALIWFQEVEKAS